MRLFLSSHTQHTYIQRILHTNMLGRTVCLAHMRIPSTLIESYFHIFFVIRQFTFATAAAAAGVRQTKRNGKMKNVLNIIRNACSRIHNSSCFKCFFFFLSFCSLLLRCANFCSVSLFLSLSQRSLVFLFPYLVATFSLQYISIFECVCVCWCSELI